MPKIQGEIIGKVLSLLGYDGTDFRSLRLDSDGHLQVDVLSGGGGGDATAANQNTMITALEKLDDLQGALGSVDTDDLQVDVKTSGLPTGAATAANQSSLLGKMKDQVFTYKGQLLVAVEKRNEPAGTVALITGYVPANEVWFVSFASVVNFDTSPSSAYIAVRNNGDFFRIIAQNNPAKAETVHAQLAVVLVEGDRIHAQMTDCAAGDDCYLAVFGYKMTV